MINEVAPPGWGHTKAEKEKTKPDKPKSKIGGTAAAFKRALDDGRFKGLPGSTTKKEKTADMFKLMWSMKKKGDKPHYKPGTDKKYKKYQEEQKTFKQFKADLYELAGDSVGGGILGSLGNLLLKGASGAASALHGMGGSRQRVPVPKKTPKLKPTSNSPSNPGSAEKYKKYQEESTMPNVDSKDRKYIKDRAKNLFKKDIKGTVSGVNEADEKSYEKFIRQSRERREAIKKRGEESKKRDAEYVDSVKKGIKFYD